MKKIYISGAITGIEDTAPALFEAAELEVKELGFEPVNPMTISHDHDKTWQSYMRTDIKALCDCDAIYMLSNWRTSRGAKVEFELANHLELDIIHQHKKL